MNGQVVNPDQVSVVRLACEDRWVRLELSLGRVFAGGELVEFAPAATVTLEGVDEMSSSYRRANWVGGVTCGALYAFRTLSVLRRHLILSELSGRVRASDMTAVATCASVAVAQLAGKQFQNLPLDGWAVQTQVVERSAAPSRADQGAQPPTRTAAQDERPAEERMASSMPLAGTFQPREGE